MRRPALLSLSLYVLGIFLVKALAVPIFHLSVSLISLFLGAFVLHCLSKPRPATYLLISAFFLTGSLSYSLSTNTDFPGHIGNYLNRRLLLRGTVIDEPECGPLFTTFLCGSGTVVSAEKSEAVSGKVLVKWKTPKGDLRYGDLVELRGSLRPAGSFSNPRGFDYGEYLSRRGIYGIFSVAGQDLKVIASDCGNPFFAKIILPIKRFVRENVDASLSGDAAGLLKGVLLGERKAISKKVEAAFANTGVIHVLAVSGFNVGIIASILFLVLRLLRLPFRPTVLSIIALLPLYAFITGLQPSVVRATVMAVCLLIGEMLERETDLLNILGFAGLVILLFNPQSLFDVGFQLSFLATGSILYFYPILSSVLAGLHWRRHRFFTKWIIAPFAVSVSAQLGIMPLVAYHFFTLPLITVFANLAVVPLIGAAISLGFASSLASLVSEGLREALAASNWVVLTSTLSLVSLLDSLPLAFVRVAQPSLFLVVLYYLAVISLANWRSSRLARKLAIFSLLIGLNFWVWTGALNRRHLEVTYLDLGRGESCFIRLPNQRTILIDGGGRHAQFDAGKDVVAPFLYSHGIRRIDLVVLSNPYTNHAGGLPYILENFKVGLVVEPGLLHESFTYRKFVESARLRSIPYRVVRRGDVIEDLGIPIHILHPAEGPLLKGSNLREMSLVLEFTYGDVTFLFPGDHFDPALYAGVDVLKLPCYGKRQVSPRDLATEFSPKIAICSTTGFGEEGEKMITLCEDMGAEVYRTNRDGAVVLRTDGKQIRVRTVKSARPRTRDPELDMKSDHHLLE